MKNIILKLLSLVPHSIQSRLVFYFQLFSRSYLHHDAVNLLLQHTGLQKLNYLDVGARRGVDTKHWAYRQFLNFILFEPDPQECKFLAEFYSDVRNIAVSDGEGKLELNVTEDPGGSYTSDNPHAAYHYGNKLLKKVGVVGKKTQVGKKVVCEKKRIDQCNIGGNIVILKIDVQGEELSVLEGLGSLRPGCLKIEISSAHNEQSPSQLEEIMSWARENNYLLVGISLSDKHRYPFKSQFEKCFQGDYLFIDAQFQKCSNTQLLVSIGLIMFDLADIAIAVLDDKILAKNVEKLLKNSSAFSFDYSKSRYNNAHDKRQIIK